MRVCADPQGYPASSQSQEGFDNRIAAIIASELGARLTFVWTTARGDEVVRRHLRSGDCDAFFGVADGAMGLYSSVAYYRMPYVFLYRQDSGLDISSLHDERLADLRVSTYPEGVPYSALLEVGLRDNLVLQRPDQDETGLNRFSPMMEALLAGETDVVIAYASEAGEFLKENPDEVRLAPVSPEITATGLQLFRILTIGVRFGDEALRDQINIALARRWDDIQAVFAEYGVPVSPLPKPSEVPGRDVEARVGVVLPIPTGNAKPTDVMGEAARLGAKIADDLVGREVSQTGVALRLFLASAPSLAASVRAAERLISTDEVKVLVGGFSQEEALALSEIAAEHNVLFFNVGAPDNRLRGALCEATTFHIEASAAMYLGAIVNWFVSEEKGRWFLVYEDTSRGQSQFESAAAAVIEAGGEVVGEAKIRQQQFVYQAELEQIKESSPDTILLLLTETDQELFMAQYELEELDSDVTGFPTEASQTRAFLFRLRQSAPTAARYRVALWDTTLSQNGAQAINERFVARAGEPMEPAAWATYAAIKIAYEALVATDTAETTELIAFLESPEAKFDVQKGPGVSFRAWNHQLRQPLYLLEINPDVPWSTALDDRIAALNLIGELPTLYQSGLEPTENLDTLGDGITGSQCQF